MAYEKKPNEQRKVAWFLQAKNLIKFVEDEATFKLSANVIEKSNFAKFPLLKGDIAEVTITNGEVTYLRKVKVEAKVEGKGSEEAYNEPTSQEEKQAPRPTEAPKEVVKAPVQESAKVETKQVEPSTEAKELTVFAVATNKKVLKFLELKDNGWYQIAEDIQKQDYQAIGLVAKNKVQVVLQDKTVVSVAWKAVAAPESTLEATTASETTQVNQAPVKAPVQAPKKEWRPFDNKSKDDYWTNKLNFDREKYDVKESDKQKSIEVQSAVGNANELVGRVAANIDPKPTASVLNNMIRSIAESNYALIQELKKK